MSNVSANVWGCSPEFWRRDANRTRADSQPQNAPSPLTFEHAGVGCLWKKRWQWSGFDYIEWRSVGSARRAVNTGRGVSKPENILTCWTHWPVCPPGHGTELFLKLLRNFCPYLDVIRICYWLIEGKNILILILYYFWTLILWPKIHIVYF